MAHNDKDEKGMIWSATYSNVPVYEFNVDDNHIMRRRKDGWINATQILKVADFDKPARTRILEREVQKGIHEKVQGGYGKYQGTWIPLELGQQLAVKNGVYEKLKPIFDYVPGNVTPPPAPKHTTAASTKPKAQRIPAVRKPIKPLSVPLQRHFNDDSYDNHSVQINDDDSTDNSTVVSESMVEEDDFVPHAYYPSSRKRKRALEPSAEWSKVEEEHRLYADALLDYFVLHEGDGSRYSADPPEPPKAFQVDRAIDTQGHTALHWAAAMGDVSIIKDLISRGANIMARNVRGETPLIRACLFANCYEKGTMAKVVHLLRNTITIPDKYGGTVFHHVAYTAHSNAKTSRARYYLELLLNKLSETVSKTEATKCLNSQDHRGDTAFHIAARYSKRCVRVFQGAGVASDIPNNNLETVEQILQKNVKQYKNSDLSLLSSSPIMADMPSAMNREPRSRSFTNNVSFTQDGYQTQTSHDFSMSFGLINQKAQDFVEAGETEVQQMNAVLADAERLLQITSTEGAVVQQRFFQLKALDEDVGIDHLQEEDVLLVRQAEAMQEQIQHRAIHALVRREEATAIGKDQAKKAVVDIREERLGEERGNKQINDAINVSAGKSDAHKKYLAALRLAEEQKKRKSLTREVVRRLANEGMSETGEQCRRLMMMTMSVPEQALPCTADEVLKELEMSRNDCTTAIVME